MDVTKVHTAAKPTKNDNITSEPAEEGPSISGSLGLTDAKVNHQQKIEDTDPTDELSHVPAVISHLRDNFGALAPALEPHVYRQGLVNVSIEEMYVVFFNRAEYLVDNILQQVTDEIFINQVTEMLTSILSQEFGDEAATYVRIISNNSSGAVLFMALLNDNCLLNLVKIAQHYLAPQPGRATRGGYRNDFTRSRHMDAVEPRNDYHTFYQDPTRPMDRVGDSSRDTYPRSYGPYSSEQRISPVVQPNMVRTHSDFHSPRQDAMIPKPTPAVSTGSHPQHQPIPQERPPLSQYPQAPHPSKLGIRSSPPALPSQPSTVGASSLSSSAAPPVAPPLGKVQPRPFVVHHHHHHHSMHPMPVIPPVSTVQTVLGPQQPSRTPAIPAPLSVQQQRQQLQEHQQTIAQQQAQVPQENAVSMHTAFRHSPLVHHHHIAVRPPMSPHSEHPSTPVRPSTSSTVAATSVQDLPPSPQSTSSIPVQALPPAKPAMKLPVHHHHHHQFIRPCQILPTNPAVGAVAVSVQQRAAPIAVDTEVESNATHCTPTSFSEADELRSILVSGNVSEKMINDIVAQGKTARELADMPYPELECFLRSTVPTLMHRQRIHSALKAQQSASQSSPSAAAASNPVGGPPPQQTSLLRNFLQKNSITTAGCKVESDNGNLRCPQISSQAAAPVPAQSPAPRLGVVVPQPRTKQQAKSPTQATPVSNAACPTEVSHVSSDLDTNNVDRGSDHPVGPYYGRVDESVGITEGKEEERNRRGGRRGKARGGGFSRGRGRGGYRDDETIVCKYYNKPDGCHFGDNCRYRHS